MKQFEADFGRWVISVRWWIIVLTIAAVAGMASGAARLVFINDMRVFFSEQNPQLKALEALENTYSKINNVMFVVAPKDKNVFTKQALTAVAELTELSWQIPYSSRVDSITNFQHTYGEEDDLIVRDLVEDAPGLDDAAIERIKKIALAEPLMVNRFLSPSGHVTAVNTNVIKPGKSNDEVTEVAAYARKMAEDFRVKYPGIDIHITGGVMFDNAFAEASKNDMTTLVPAMFVTLIVVVGVCLRAFSGMIGTLFIILFSLLSAMGLAGWLGIKMTPAAANAPTIILTLAVADSVHMLTTMFHHMRLGKSKHDAIAESVRINLQPVFITSVTTAIGFLTMNFSDAPPFRDLGNIVAMGVMAAFVYSVTFLPAFMSILPVRTKAAYEKEKPGAMDRLATFVIARRRGLFWGMLAVAVMLASGIANLQMGDEWVKYFDKRYEIRRSTDFLIENLSGFNIIEYSLEAGESGGINDPEYLQVVDEFTEWYKKQLHVIHVNSIVHTYKRLNKNMHGDDPAYYAIPDARDLAAQYLLLFEMSLPFGLDMNSVINVDKSATRFLVTLRGATTTELREMDRRARLWLKENAPERMFTYGSGLSIIWAHISKRNINSMIGASLGALVIISMILIAAFRSFRIGIMSMAPNLVPSFMAFGVWGYTVGQAGLAVSVIVAMTLGIVVDDTVHFLSKYLRARRENGMDTYEGVRYAFNTVGTALWVTTLALVAGFFVLSFSGFKVNADMGVLAAVTISLALILDFLFLPALLMKVEEGGEPEN